MRHRGRQDHGPGGDRSSAEGGSDPALGFRAQIHERRFELHVDPEGEVFRDSGHAGDTAPVGDSLGALGRTLHPLGNCSAQPVRQPDGVASGIAGRETLRAMVERGALNPAGGEPSADATSFVDDDDGAAGAKKFAGGDQSRHTRSNDEDIGRLLRGIHSGADASSHLPRRQRTGLNVVLPDSVPCGWKAVIHVERAMAPLRPGRISTGSVSGTSTSGTSTGDASLAVPTAVAAPLPAAAPAPAPAPAPAAH